MSDDILVEIESGFITALKQSRIWGEDIETLLAFKDRRLTEQ